MTRKKGSPLRDVAASVKARLLEHARARGKDLQARLEDYVLERLLYLLRVSSHAADFVHTGLLLYGVWSDRRHRATRDLDLGSGTAEPPSQGSPKPTPQAKDKLMTLAEQWKAEGEAKGRAEGEAKGRAEGEAKWRVSSILQILGARQKVLTPGERAVIEQCSDIARLDAWLVKAATLSETRELFDQTD